MTETTGNHLSPTSAAKWYDLLKKIFSDIRGQKYKSKNEKLKRYRDLYNAISNINKDYISIFQNFVDDIMLLDREGDLESIKKNFLAKRSRKSSDRTLSKQYARSYLNLCEDIAEKRFFAAIIIYFYYESDGTFYNFDDEILDVYIWSAGERGGLYGWDSASTSFWGIIRCEDDPEIVALEAKKVIESIGIRFAVVERKYSELEGCWRHSKEPITTKISKLILNQKNNEKMTDVERFDG